MEGESGEGGVGVEGESGEVSFEHKDFLIPNDQQFYRCHVLEVNHIP